MERIPPLSFQVVSNLDQSGNIKRDSFIKLHEFLVRKLKTKYRDQSYFQSKEIWELTKLKIWMYGKNKKEKPQKDLKTLSDLYLENDLVKEFVKGCIKHKDGFKEEKILKKINVFELRIYDAKTKLFPTQNKIKGPCILNSHIYLYGLFLILESDNLPAYNKETKANDWWRGILFKIKNENWAEGIMEPGPSPFEGEIEEKSPIKISIDFHHLIGLYFSVKSFNVKSFFLDVSKSPTENGEYQVLEKGFHNLETDLSKKEEEVEYEGAMEMTEEGYCFVTLNKKRGNKRRRLNINWFIENAWKKNDKIFRGSIQGVSKNNHFINAECIFIPISREQKHTLTHNKRNIIEAKVLKYNEYLNISFYLTIQRRTFRTTKEEITEVANIRARKNMVDSFADSFPGIYRIWQFSLTRGHIIQSRVIVKDTGIVYLDTIIKDPISKKEKPQRFNCVLNITKEKKLCIYSFFPRSLNISNFAILDFTNYAKTNYIEGIFSSVGDDKEGIIGGYMIWRQEKSGYSEGLESSEISKKIKVKTFNREEVLKLRKEDTSLNDFLRALFGLWRKKLWKKKTDKKKKRK